MTTKGSRGSASTKLLVVVVLVVAAVAGLHAFRAKSTPSLDGTWSSKDLLGTMIITKTSADTYSVTYSWPSSPITLTGTLQGGTLHLQRATSGDWPVCFKRAWGGLDEKAVRGNQLIAHWTKQ